MSVSGGEGDDFEFFPLFHDFPSEFMRDTQGMNE